MSAGDREDFWRNRAESAEAKLNTLKEQIDPALERIRNFKRNYGFTESMADGTIKIKYDKFVLAIGIDGALELRAIIDETYMISGEAGDKPKVRIAAETVDA